MPKIDLSKAEEGVVVSEAIKGPNGQPLLSAGITLTNKHIRILKTWGIPVITIEGDAAETEAEPPIFSAEDLQHATEQQSPRFCHADLSDPVTAYLFSEAVKQQAIAASQSHRP